MSTSANLNVRRDNHRKKKHSLVDSIRILSDMTFRDIEKSYNIESTYDTAGYYNNRYGRRAVY